MMSETHGATAERSGSFDIGSDASISCLNGSTERINIMNSSGLDSLWAIPIKPNRK